jgi:DNA-binding HxlR family transcriptional regulator
VTLELEQESLRSDYEGACQASAGGDGRVIRDVLDLVGDKWSLLIIVSLEESLLRFTELQRHIPGISQRMLTLTLRRLERDGLITRTVHAEVPPRVEYDLTDVGRTLIGPSAALAEWAIANQLSISEARERYDAARNRQA